MELSGAQKDGECSKVDVQGGVALDLGCCNYFEPQDESVDRFCCGECKYGSSSERPNDTSGAMGNGDQQSKPAADNPLRQLKANPRRMG
jgi:hypothetical protein